MGLKELEEMYALHSKFYDITRWLFVWKRKKAIALLDLKKGETVLVVGCGTGYGFNKIIERIGKKGRIIGVDYSKHMLDKARKKHSHYKNVNFIQADAAKYIPPRVDSVLYSYSITMIPEWQKSLKNSIAFLKKGGKLVIVDFGRCRIPLINKLLDWNFKKHGVDNYLDIQRELRKHFENINYKEYFFGYVFIAEAG